MKFSKLQFVYIDIKYVEYMNNADSEIFFDKNNEEYKLKPHLGILLNNESDEKRLLCKLLAKYASDITLNEDGSVEVELPDDFADFQSTECEADFFRFQDSYLTPMMTKEIMKRIRKK